MEAENKDANHKILDVNFWNYRWKHNMTGWDIGYPSPPITNYIDQYKNKDSAILIAGCGNAHEAEYLVKNGFNNITLLDISEIAVELLQTKFKNYNQVKVICDNLFLHNGEYDLIIEQTLFCTFVDEMRYEYAKKMASLLKPNGRLVGVLFNVEFANPGPPFGGNKLEYIPIFDTYFNINIMEECYNSIEPRAGNELFIKMVKK